MPDPISDQIMVSSPTPSKDTERGQKRGGEKERKGFRTKTLSY